MPRILLFFIALFMLPFSAQAGVVVKLATLAPEGSTWHKALVKMGDEWSQISKGEVTVKIYAGGVSGNETVMLRKIRIGQLHAGALTNLGLSEIHTGPSVISSPMLIQTYPELDHVMKTMGPVFEQHIQDKGFIVLNWGDAGWARLFTKRPFTDPSQAGTLKIFVWEGDQVAVEMYKKAGFNPVAIPATDVLPSLQSGLIDSFPATPLTALAFQWFGIAKHMLDVPWGPLMGATVIKKEAWERIPEAYRGELLAAARRIGAETQATIRRQDAKAIEVMKKYGLTVHPVDAATRAKWEELGMAAQSIVRGKMVSEGIFDQTKALVESYRAAQ